MDVGRREAYRTTIGIIQAFPLFGTGIGTFEDVFPAYRSLAMPTMLVWDYAHSTPLQFAAEMGLVVSAAAALLWFAVAVFLIRGIFGRRRDAFFPLCGFAVGLLGTLHSMVDFPLQIPGYSIVWAAVIGTALAQSVRSSE